VKRLRFVGLVLATFGTCSFADTLPLGITAAAAVLDNSSGSVCTQSGATYAACSFNGATAVANVTNGTGGLASVSLGSNTSAGAAVTEYYMYLQGPTNVQVPIIINGMASTSDNGADIGVSYAAYYIYQDSSKGLSYFGQYFASPSTCAILSSLNCMSTGNFSLDTTLSSDTVFFVFFEAAAGGANASALIDPTIQIDPSFAQASQFSVVANPGVFAPAPNTAPEPGGIGLMVAGLAAAALFVRRGLGRAAFLKSDG